MIIWDEIGCKFFVILGDFTRFATIPLIFSMLVVIFIVHASDPFQMKELPLLYLGIYILLFFTGAGRISLDAIISKKWMEIFENKEILRRNPMGLRALFHPE